MTRREKTKLPRRVALFDGVGARALGRIADSLPDDLRQVFLDSPRAAILRG
ncbi:MAG: hypothetical protein QN163_01030 [Armatimonadota bacterium]|nr:hypothetical protein [Armatimonadota bacterium]MDR5697646.1 hypothetical protein [Armatimonadota bacterium]